MNHAYATLLAGALALGCADTSTESAGEPPGIGDSTSDTDGVGGNTGPTIDATVRVLDAMSGSGMADVTVENAAEDTATTDSSGSATLSVPADDTFSILLQRSDAIDHLLFGPTGPEDFSYVTFMATQVLVSGVSAMLGATIEEGTGVVVVGIDYDNLAPAVGASADLDGEHGEPWVLTSTGASFGDTILPGAMGMVAFSNVQPGDVNVSVTPPDGADCTAFPGGGEMPAAPVQADLVTVVTFHCR